jgi:prophage regulatory protein
MSLNTMKQQAFFRTPMGDDASASRPTILLARADLRARGIHYSNPHLIDLERRGLFPGRVTLSPAKVAWVESEVDEWLSSHLAARDSIALGVRQ